MPKKVSTRRKTPHNKPKAQKSIEIVRQTHHMSEEQTLNHEVLEQTTEKGSDEQESKTNHSAEPLATVDTEIKKGSDIKKTTSASITAKSTRSSPRGSRRQSPQKVQARAASALVTVEHYTYVRHDLLLIAILAAIMFSAIIILHFVPNIGS